MGSRSRHVVRAEARLSRRRYSRRAAQHRRDQARVVSFRDRQEAGTASRRRRADRRQRQLGTQPPYLRMGTASCRDPYDWAVRFESAAKDMMLAGEYNPLINYDTLGRDAALSIPTPDHYLPLLYVLAARQSTEHSISRSKGWTAVRSRCCPFRSDSSRRTCRAH